MLNKYTITLKKTAYFAGGCFWCVEAVFQRVKGVEAVVSGYMGGTIKNPAYREVCTGRTGHTEAVKVTYDPSEVTYELLVAIFFSTHDPTTLNRQGADVGTQYRSAIFYTNDEQHDIIVKIILELTGSFQIKSGFGYPNRLSQNPRFLYYYLWQPVDAQGDRWPLPTRRWLQSESTTLGYSRTSY